MATRGYWREPDGTPLTVGEALAEWATETYGLLEKVAGTYQALITHDDLAEIMQAATQIRTTAPSRLWIDRVLALVAEECVRRGDPPLTSLVIAKRDGRVGEHYRTVLALTGTAPIDDDVDLEWQAAYDRLDCYHHFGASLPEDGGQPALTPAALLWAETAPPPPPRPAAPVEAAPAPRAATPRVAKQPAAPRAAKQPAAPRVAKPKKVAAPPPKPPAVCPKCFMQLPATGICDSCAGY